jgi:hypothetical protein
MEPLTAAMPKVGGSTLFPPRDDGVVAVITVSQASAILHQHPPQVFRQRVSSRRSARGVRVCRNACLQAMGTPTGTGIKAIPTRHSFVDGNGKDW